MAVIMDPLLAVVLEVVALGVVVDSPEVVEVSEAVVLQGGGKYMNFARVVHHLTTGLLTTAKHFPTDALKEIEDLIAKSEARHTGQIRFAVEPALSLSALLKGVTPRERALQVFSDLRIWDTEANCGVLLYVLEADHEFEIIADRGIARHCPQAFWEGICREIEGRFRSGSFKDGVLEALRLMTEELERHFPRVESTPDELSNRAVVIRS